MMASTRVFTFTTAAFGSVPGSKIICIVASPALVASEVIYCIPCTPFMALSNGIRVDSTNTCALDPG